MSLFAAKQSPENSPAMGRVVFVIGAPDSDYELIARTTKLLGMPVFDKTPELETINYDLLRTLKLDLSAMHLMPDNWEKNDLLSSIKDEIREFARTEIAGKGTLLIASSNLSRTASLWAEGFAASGIISNFIICFAKPTDNYLPWLVYNLEAEKNSRGAQRAFVHLPEFLGNWRKIMRKISHQIDFEFENWLSTTREQEIESGISTKNVSILPQEKRTTPINVKRLYSALRDAAGGKKYDETVTEEILPDIQLFFAPLIQKNTEIADLKKRLSKIEDEVIDLRDRISQPDDDMNEAALEDGTINKAREEGEKIYLQSWRSWAAERKKNQDFAQYPLFAPNAPLQGEVAELVFETRSNPVVILDIMSPPITSVGTYLDGYNLRVIPTSPYANEFNMALQQAGIKPPVPVIKVLPEDLLNTFGAKSIDIIHCREAIEYVKNPVIVLTEMLAVMKDNGAIFLSHQVNKASEENFNTLAQWNCVEKGGQFIIWNSWYKFNISSMLAGSYEVDAKSYIDFVEVVIRRKK